MASKSSLKTELHHWWPKSLSKFWEDEEGCATQIRPDGHVTRSPPSNFGAITNAHHIKLAKESPWNSSFEQSFNRADSVFPSIVERLSILDTPIVDPGLPFEDRVSAALLPTALRVDLSECMASLVIRSPCTRNMIKLRTEYIQTRMGCKKPSVPKLLIASNLNGMKDLLAASMVDQGKFVVLFSDSKEFIFGDGFLHNFSVREIAHFDVRCLVALTPFAVLAYLKPSTYYSPNQIISIRLSPEEVGYLNDVVQIYSCNEIFYRSHKPKLIDAFKKKEFLQLKRNKNTWLERFIDQAARCYIPSGGDRVILGGAFHR